MVARAIEQRLQGVEQAGKALHLIEEDARGAPSFDKRSQSLVEFAGIACKVQIGRFVREVHGK